MIFPNVLNRGIYQFDCHVIGLVHRQHFFGRQGLIHHSDDDCREEQQDDSEEFILRKKTKHTYFFTKLQWGIQLILL